MSSTSFAESPPASRNENGDYVLSESSFSSLWSDYNRLKDRDEVMVAYLDGNKERVDTLADSIQSLSEIIHVQSDLTSALIQDYNKGFTTIDIVLALISGAAVGALMGVILCMAQ
jgi:hypothetical protein